MTEPNDVRIPQPPNPQYEAMLAQEKRAAERAHFRHKVYLSILRYGLGPVLVLVIGGGYAHSNHGKSARGYETLAISINQDVATALRRIEDRLDALERTQASHEAALTYHRGLLPSHERPPSSQPQVLPAPAKNPYADLRRDVNRYAKEARAPKLAPRVPNKLQDVW